MSTTANPSSSPMQAQNSPRMRQSRKSSAARGGVSSPSDMSPPPISMSGIVDQEQFLTSSSTTASDSFSVKEALTMMTAGSFGEDGSATTGEDGQLDNSENGGAAKKPVWSKPSNGDVGAVMGAESWPALSESARASPKSPATYSLKALSHGPVISEELSVVSLPSPKEVSVSISAPTTPNHAVPSRQRSMKRGGGSGSSSHNSTPANDSSPQLHAPIDASSPNAGKPGGTIGESSRDNPNKEGGQRGGTHGGNESHPQRNSFRRSNSGPLARADGSYHGNHGRRDHERGKQDWGSRSFGSHGPQQRVGSRPFVRGPAPNTSFIPPPPPPVAVRPFVGPVVYTEMPSPVFYVPGPPDPLRPMSMVPIQYFPMADPHLPSKIVNQIDYYFSNENLVKDTFLRQNMDVEGWVPIKLIAGFKKVMQLTDNIQLILDTVKASNVVEVQGDKVRRKGDWMKWIMPSLQTPVTSPQSINRSSPNMLAAHFNSVALDEKAA